MPNRSKLLPIVLLASVLAAPAAWAQASGKAPLDSVIPAGATDPSSGAPAAWHKPIHDTKPYHSVLIDRLEYGDADGPDNYLWDAQAWFGNDYHKLWFKTEGEGPTHGGSPEGTEFQLLYDRTLTPFFDGQLGVRYDVNPNPDRGFLVLGLRGLAPLWFETDTALFVSEDGDVSFRGELEYDLRLTQRLILQPRAEINLSARDTPEYGLGRGLNNTEMGLRLRYELRREFAPYIGVRWEQTYGDTKDFARREGEDTSSTAFVVGVRAWY